MDSQNQPQKSQVVTVIIIGLLIAMMQMARGLFAARDTAPSAGFQLLSYLLVFSVMGCWLEKDNRNYRIAWVFDMGFFLYIAWPLIIPYYLIKTRGFKKAAMILLAFISLYFGTSFLGALLGIVLLP